MIIDFYKIIPLILISSVIYIFNIKFFDFTYKRADLHQKYSSDFLGNPIGGYAIFFFVIFFLTLHNRDTLGMNNASIIM